MRKTSQDGGDTSSITSGIENEIKKSAAGIVKAKKSSIRRKVQSLSHESDDGVIEPLLQKEKEKSGILTQSAKHLLSKTKTDMKNDKADNKEKLLRQDKLEMSTTTNFSSTTDNIVNEANGSYKSYGLGTGAVHNHMNVNIFGSPDGLKNIVTTKSQMLVEVDISNPGSYSSSPLIFTTAKIHTDGKKTHMEPVQVTPVPILSTIEGSLIKNTSKSENEKTIDLMPIKIENKKSDLSDTDLFGNNSLNTTSSYGNTKQVTGISGVKLEVKQDLSKLSNINTNVSIPTTKLPDITKQTETIANITKKVESTSVQSASKSPSSVKCEDNLEQENEPLHVASIKTDVNKNFESCFSEIKQASISKTPIEQKQLQRQKNSSVDDKDTYLPKSSNVQTQLKKSIDNTTGVNLPLKNSQNHIVLTSVTTFNPTQNSKLPNSVTSIATTNTTSKTEVTKAAASNVIAPSISNAINSVVIPSQTITNITTSVELQEKPTSTSIIITKPTATVVTNTGPIGITTSSDQTSKNSVVSVTSSRIPKGVPVSCAETPGKNIQSIFSKDPINFISSNLTQHDKGNKLKTKSASTNNTVTKSVPSVTTSNKSLTNVSKPVLLPSSNKVTVAISSAPKSISKTTPNVVAVTSSTTTNKTTISSTQSLSSPSVTLVTSTCAMTSVTSVANKSTSVSSKSQSSPSTKLVTSIASGKIPDTTISSQIINNSVITTTKSMTDSKPLTTTTKVPTSLNKEQSTHARTPKGITSVKSPITPSASTSFKNSSVLHNQNKAQSSETKKGKLK